MSCHPVLQAGNPVLQNGEPQCSAVQEASQETCRQQVEASLAAAAARRASGGPILRLLLADPQHLKAVWDSVISFVGWSALFSLFPFSLMSQIYVPLCCTLRRVFGEAANSLN